jgi:hypothetical protein
MRRYYPPHQSDQRRNFSLGGESVLPDCPLVELGVRQKSHTRLHPDILDQVRRIAIEERMPASDAADYLLLIGIAIRERSTALYNLAELSQSHLARTRRFLAGGSDE